MPVRVRPELQMHTTLYKIYSQKTNDFVDTRYYTKEELLDVFKTGVPSDDDIFVFTFAVDSRSYMWPSKFVKMYNKE